MTWHLGGDRDLAVGIFGGCFDPPHLGHARAAVELLERLPIDRLIVIPSGDPPHRDTVLPAAARFELVNAMFAGEERIEVSALELERPGPSYTVNTLAELSRRVTGARFMLAMGTEQFATFDSWRDPLQIAELVEIVVMRRGGEEFPEPSPFGIEYVALELPRLDITSSRIRRLLAEGRSIRYLVPESIRYEIEAAWRRTDPVGQISGVGYELAGRQ